MKIDTDDLRRWTDANISSAQSDLFWAHLDRYICKVIIDDIRKSIRPEARIGKEDLYYISKLIEENKWLVGLNYRS